MSWKGPEARRAAAENRSRSALARSGAPADQAHKVAAWLTRNGYTIVPINDGTPKGDRKRNH